MSFLYDFFDYFKTYNPNEKPMITLVFGVGIMIVGNVKIANIADDFVDVIFKKKLIKVVGNGLKIKSISKGELVVEGNVLRVEQGDSGVK